MCFKKHATVEISVCADSRLLPNQYCISTTKARFYLKPKPGEPALPTTTCSVHQAPIPIPTPKVKVWIGVYDFQVATGNWQGYLDRVKEAGAYGVRLFADCQWNWQGTRPFLYASYDEAIAEAIRYKDHDDPKKIENRNGIMTLVRDSGMEFPLFDYKLPRSEYWAHLREILAYCKKIGLVVWLVFTDYCTLKTPGDPKYFSPWCCAQQRMMPGIEQGVWGPQMRNWFALFYQACIVELNKSGVDYIVEDMNEGDSLDNPSDFMLNWFKCSNRTIKDLNVPTAKIVTTASRNTDVIADLCGFYSPHGIGIATDIRPYWGQGYTKTIWSSDGFWGGEGAADIKGRRGLGEVEARKIARRTLEVGGAGFEYLPRGRYSLSNDRADLDVVQDDFEVITALSLVE